MGTMEQVTETFIQNADWLTVHDEPAVAALRYAARALDESSKPNGAILTQYNKIWHGLMNGKADEAPSIDEDEALLRGLEL